METPSESKPTLNDTKDKPEESKEKADEFKDKEFLQRFNKDMALYDIPHTNYLFKTFEENQAFRPDLSFI